MKKEQKQQVVEELTARLQAAELVALDTETTSLDEMRAEIVGISFSVTPACSTSFIARFTVMLMLGDQTIGIVLVACMAASAPGVPVVTITSGFRLTSSVAKPGSRSSCPSAHRNSMAMFSPEARLRKVGMEIHRTRLVTDRLHVPLALIRVDQPGAVQQPVQTPQHRPVEAAQDLLRR